MLANKIFCDFFGKIAEDAKTARQKAASRRCACPLPARDRPLRLPCRRRDRRRRSKAPRVKAGLHKDAGNAMGKSGLTAAIGARPVIL